MRAPRITPESMARVLNGIPALLEQRGYDPEGWGETGRLCVEALVWTQTTGNPFGNAPGYEGEKARRLGSAVQEEVNKRLSYCDYTSWETVAAFFEFVAQCLRDEAEQDATEQAEFLAELRANRQAVAA